MSGRMREETGLTVPLLRRPPRTPAAFNGRIRDKRERKQELHPSANEIFAVHSRVRGSEGQKEATKTRPPLSSLHYQDYTASSVRSTVETDAKSSVITHFSKFRGRNAWFWGQTQSCFLLPVTNFHPGVIKDRISGPFKCKWGSTNEEWMQWGVVSQSWKFCFPFWRRFPITPDISLVASLCFYKINK